MRVISPLAVSSSDTIVEFDPNGRIRTKTKVRSVDETACTKRHVHIKTDGGHFCYHVASEVTVL